MQRHVWYRKGRKHALNFAIWRPGGSIAGTSSVCMFRWSVGQQCLGARLCLKYGMQHGAGDGGSCVSSATAKLNPRYADPTSRVSPEGGMGYLITGSPPIACEGGDLPIWMTEMGHALPLLSKLTAR